jgi:hypothetical protein
MTPWLNRENALVFRDVIPSLSQIEYHRRELYEPCKPVNVLPLPLSLSFEDSSESRRMFPHQPPDSVFLAVVSFVPASAVEMVVEFPCYGISVLRRGGDDVK